MVSQSVGNRRDLKLLHWIIHRKLVKSEGQIFEEICLNDREIRNILDQYEGLYRFQHGQNTMDSFLSKRSDHVIGLYDFSTDDELRKFFAINHFSELSFASLYECINKQEQEAETARLVKKRQLSETILDKIKTERSEEFSFLEKYFELADAEMPIDEALRQNNRKIIYTPEEFQKMQIAKYYLNFYKR